MRFHDVIYMATDNPKLIQLLNNFREQMYRFRVEYLKKAEVRPQLLAEHDEIIKYITEGNKEEASQVVTRHIENQALTVQDVIRKKS